MGRTLVAGSKQKRPWVPLIGAMVFSVYCIHMMTLLDAAHKPAITISSPIREQANKEDRIIGDTRSSGIGSGATRTTAQTRNSCWMIPEQVPASEFSPKQFMEEGPGKQYIDLYKKQAPPVLHVRFAIYHLLSSCQPVYYHIHKNGGTTMNVQDSPIVDAFYTPRERSLGSPQFQNEAKQTMTDVFSYQRQQANSTTEMPFFTFLRDPVTRFVSGVGQALKLNKVAPCNRQPDTVSLLDCILTKIDDSGSFLDEHLMPQAYELYHGIMGLDLKIQVMDISELGGVLRHLGFGMGAADGPKKRRISRGKSTFNLSAAALTPSLIERICETYKVDVLLLRTAALSKSICSQDHVAT